MSTLVAEYPVPMRDGTYLPIAVLSTYDQYSQSIVFIHPEGKSVTEEVASRFARQIAVDLSNSGELVSKLNPEDGGCGTFHLVGAGSLTPSDLHDLATFLQEI